MKFFIKAALLLSSVLTFSCVFSQSTDGTLTFTFTAPKHTSGCYVSSDCRYVLAAWIETGDGSAAGAFVKTKLRYVGGTTNDHLPTWAGKAGCPNTTSADSSTCNTTDATTGATQTTFTSKTFAWDGKNVTGLYNGSTVTDGSYQVVIQETWGHGTSTVTRRFGFTKGIAIDSQTPTSDSNFTGISLKWVPTALAVNEINNKAETSISPNPSKGVFDLNFKSTVNSIMVFDMSGNLVYSEDIKFPTLTKKSLNINNLSNGNYILKVSNAYGTSDYKIIVAK